VQMAQIQYAKGHYPEAEQYIKRFEKATRHFKPAPLALAFKVYKKQGKTKIANSYAAMLVKMFPQSLQAKQYLINGLAHIEADTWAEKYHQLNLNNKFETVQQKKRVIKLSPHKAPARQKQSSSKTVSSVQETDVNIAKNTGELVKSNEPTKTKTAIAQVTVKQNQKVIEQHIIAPLKEKQNTEYKSKKSQETPMALANETSKKEANVASLNTTNNGASDNNEVSVSVDTPIVEKTKAVTTKGNPQLSMTLPVHVVGSGESLFYISKKYNIRMPSLKRWNHLKKKPVLHIGDVIYLTDPKKSVNP